MKKKLCLSATLLFLVYIGGGAQSMVVVEKDGTQHKFNTDYIQEVIFEEEEIDESIVFTSLSPNVYSGTNVALTFANEDNSVKAVLDVYTPEAVVSLQPGVYTAGATEGYRIDVSNLRYTYVEANEAQQGIKSGTMTVEKNGRNYTIALDFVLADDTPLKGKYEGGVDGYDGFLSLVPTSVSYFENDFPEGEIYIKMSSSAFEAAFDFFTTATDRVLPAGTYTYSESKEAGTFSPSSYVDNYNPNKSYRFVSGSTITVTKDGENYTFDMHLIATDGMEITLTYTGSITPAKTDETESIVFTSLLPDVYSGKNAALTFANEDNSVKAVLDVYTPEAVVFLQPGIYTAGATEGYRIDVSNLLYTYVEVNEAQQGIKSGTMTVEKDGKNYTIVLDLVLADDTPFKGRYEGGAAGYDGSFVPTVARYFENDFPEGEIYIKMNDEANWKFESAFDFFTTATDRVLPAGTYTYSELEEAGTFGPASHVTTYNPSIAFKFVSGSTITVTKDGETYSFDMRLKTTEGLDITLTYTGTILPSN